MLRRHIVEIVVTVGILNGLDLLVYRRDHVLYMDSNCTNLGITINHCLHNCAVLSLYKDPIVAYTSTERRCPMTRSPASEKRSVSLIVLKNAIKQAGRLLEV